MPIAPDRGERETAPPSDAVLPLYDLLCFSHLRWHFVTQRPQHLLTRCSQHRRVFYWEEPSWDADETRDGAAWLEEIPEGETLWVLRPHLPRNGCSDTLQRGMLTAFLQKHAVQRYVRWYYTPMALPFTDHLQAQATVYDCMDELSHFMGAPQNLLALEQKLFQLADVVFAGGASLYERKRALHPNVHLFPSSIDVAHFAQARALSPDPADQAEIPRPRAGFSGVLDERFDRELVHALASLRPNIHFVFLGPSAKIDPANLPRAGNLHYLGAKEYAELPKYLAGWDVALLPFALNDATRFISPTKTPEYLAAGKPVVSTPIHDVVSDYGNASLVAIAADAEEFANEIDQALQPPGEDWAAAVARKLAASSWDDTWAAMWTSIERILEKNRRAVAQAVHPAGGLRVRRTEHFDYLIAGAGLAGSVLAERLANGLNKRVLLVDRRDHIAGNTYDYHDAAGILVHRYGPHIFHTNSAEVMQYLSRFTAWRDYEHRVLAQVDGLLVPIPINLDTVKQLYGLCLDAAGMEAFLAARAETGKPIRTSEDMVLSRVGRDLYEKFFRNYTRKQWGLDPSELDASVAGRIPVRVDHDSRYFSDTYQAMPRHGFTRMFERMLDSRNITVRCGVEYQEVARLYPEAKTVFTGPVDEFFGYRFGPLPYRSLRFEHKTYPQEHFQPAAVINYPNDHAYTRVTEFKYITGQTAPHTSVVYEYPQAEGDPYYPVPRPENTERYLRYRALAQAEPNVHFVGRLAMYKYYNMDQVVAQSLAAYRRIASAALVESGASLPLEAVAATAV